MRESLICLCELIKRKLLTSTSFALYTYFKLHEGEPLPTRQVCADLQLSSTIVNHHTHMLEILELVKVDRSGRAKQVTVQPLTRARTERLVSVHSRGTSSTIELLNAYKDAKINKWNEKKRRGGGVEVSALLRSVQQQLPANQRQFRITPAYEKRLAQLAQQLDVADYAAFFLKKKLGVTVKQFSLGIFLNQGIVDEYRQWQKKMAAARKYKTVTSRNKGQFENEATKLKEAWYGEVQR